jgi:hypothetical protein
MIPQGNFPQKKPEKAILSMNYCNKKPVFYFLRETPGDCFFDLRL